MIDDKLIHLYNYVQDSFNIIFEQHYHTVLLMVGVGRGI